MARISSVFREFDVLILGSGAAGLSAALHLSPHMTVGVLSKTTLNDGSTTYAQGGISAVMDTGDSESGHIEDTINAGCGMCDPAIVEKTVRNGRATVEWLMSIGVDFTTENPQGSTPRQLHLTREGGHSHRRVVHAADATGLALHSQLLQQSREHSNIHLITNHIAIDLITAHKLGYKRNHCIGAYVLNRDTGHVEVFKANAVILATGGASKVYLYTSNPDGSSGDGLAMAWRAGCRVANMEFMQFHPTCLYHPKAKSFLITEAIRGEGGRLLLPDGTDFLHEFDPRGVLAPRDIVARAIDYKMKQLGLECVYLDISHKPPEFIQSHFPTVYARCKTLGIDITKAPIPVVPAAHYTCGGVLVDENGCTDIEGLYAIGEVAHTGLHGANRMASNSLLECLVFGKFTASHIVSNYRAAVRDYEIPAWDESRVSDSDEEIVVAHNWDEIRRFMWDYVGIVRTTKRLQRARHRIELLQHEIEEYYSNFRVTSDLIELRNLSVAADLIIRSALHRKESRGLHYTLDYPETDPALERVYTILTPQRSPNYSETFVTTQTSIH